MRTEDVLKLDLDAVARRLKSSERGLTRKMAAARLAEHGPNVFRRRGGVALRVLGRQFRSSLIYLLVAASAVSYWIGDYTGAAVIAVILLVNTSLGFFQEYRSERIVEKLTKFIKRQVRVARDGETVLLDESEIVPGDVVTLREGDIAPADLRLVRAEDLLVNESQLTGESVPLSKQPTAGTVRVREGLVLAGSVIERGIGAGLVYATGDETELGSIAMLSTETAKETQYEKSLRSFSSFLMNVVLVGLALVFSFKIFLVGGFSDALPLLLFVIALAVAVVPEVLPVIATVSLASGSLKLAKRHVVVKRLSSMEDLGNIDLLCTDKTGTITENRMAIRSIASSDDRLFQTYAYAAIAPLKGRKRRTQNTYDDAFIEYVSDDVKRAADRLAIVQEIPFDPEGRRRRVVLEDKARKTRTLVVIGAPETLLRISEHGRRAGVLEKIASEGRSGLHHLAIAVKEIEYRAGGDALAHESGLTFLGYASMRDPLRPTAKRTVEHAEKLGIRIKILTGDSREVAEYIGNEVGLIGPRGAVYLGDELDAMSESARRKAVLACNVFARVTPTQKYRIVKTLKEAHVVGYQGDGINDAPALKLADVSIAVQSATDIAKENADIVLLHRSLDVIVNGIEYGRTIFINVNKYIKHTMVSNFGNFLALSAMFLMGSGLPLLPIQVLLTSLITDIPLISIYSDAVAPAEIVRPEKHDMRGLLFISLILGIPTALFELFYYMVVHMQALGSEETSLYLFFTFLALVIFYSIRTKGHFWNAPRPSRLLDVSFLCAFLFSLAITYVEPFRGWFSFAPLSASSIALMLALTLTYFLVADFIKVRYHRFMAATSS